MITASQKSESFRSLLAKWFDRRGLEIVTVKGRIAAGARIGFSHQAVANYLAGHLPHDNRIPSLAAAMGVGEAKLRQVIARDRAARHAGHGASDPAEAIVTNGVVQ